MVRLSSLQWLSKDYTLNIQFQRHGWTQGMVARPAVTRLSVLGVMNNRLILLESFMNTLPPYPQARLLRADAASVVVTWSFMALAALLWWISAFMLPAVGGATRLALWGMFLGGGVHVVLALLHRCPGCGKHPTIQGFKAPHPASLSQSRAAGWAGVVTSVMRRKRFACIHCGAGYAV